MQTGLITITEYCGHYQVEQSFLEALEETGIVAFIVDSQQKYIHEEQFSELEKYRKLHYELHINMEGIDAIRHLLDRQSVMRQEIDSLRNLLRVYE